MKKISVLLLTLLVLVGCGGSSEPKEELIIYNWGEFMNREIISQFESEYNVKVTLSYFDSNEAMYTKLQDGGKYDIIIPSDYMVQRLREENLLAELDYNLIPNYEAVDPSLKSRKMDPENKYTVPYFWGNVGILYNTTTVDKNAVESQGWDVFRNEDYKGRIYFYNSERDAFMVALKALGYSMNTTDTVQIEEAYNWLSAMNKEMNPVYVTDDVLDGMIGANKDIAVVYSGDANYIIKENPDMEFFAPMQGTNTWVDTMVIPEVAPNKEMAHKFMNFTLEHEMALLNTEEVGYTSPLPSVIKEVTAPGGEFSEIDSYVTRTGYDKDEEYIYDAEMKVILTNFWQKIKATN